MSTKSSGYNGSTDFEKWYKEMYGKAYNPDVGLVRGENMSDGDWNVGSVLHNYYLSERKNEEERKNNESGINAKYDNLAQSVRSDHEASRAALDKSKSTSQQTAGVMYDRLRKYLPMKAQAQGMSGLGSAQNELNAYNAYASRMGEISANHQSGIAELDKSERASISDIENARISDLNENSRAYDDISREGRETAYTDARDAWDKYVAAEEEREREEIAKRYSDVSNIINNYAGTDVDELIGYIDSYYSDNKDSADYIALVEAAKTKAENNATEDTKKEIEDAELESIKDSYDEARAAKVHGEILTYFDNPDFTLDDIEKMYKEREHLLTPEQKKEIEKKIEIRKNTAAAKESVSAVVEKTKDLLTRVFSRK